MLIRTAIRELPGVLRSSAGLWFREHDIVQPLHRNVFAILQDSRGKRRVIPASNIVTNDGDTYYAQLSASETPTNDFAAGVMEMQTAGTPGKAAIRSSFTNVAASQKAIDATYPRTNDPDPLNPGTTGVDVNTWRTSWTQGDFNQVGISHGIITVNSPAAGAPILTGYAFPSSFDKTSDDTLTVYVNHEFLGV